MPKNIDKPVIGTSISIDNPSYRDEGDSVYVYNGEEWALEGGSGTVTVDTMSWMVKRIKDGEDEEGRMIRKITVPKKKRGPRSLLKLRMPRRRV